MALGMAFGSNGSFLSLKNELGLSKCQLTLLSNAKEVVEKEMELEEEERGSVRIK